MATQREKEVLREIAKFTCKRDNRLQRMQRLYDLSQELDDDKKCREFTALASRLDASASEFADIMDHLCDLNLEINPDYKCDYQLLDKYQDLLCFVQEHLRSLKVASQAECVPISQLPKIEIPEFSGEPEKWPIFYDAFYSLIHCNKKLDDIAKVYYLLGSLKGKALDTCSGVLPTAANYHVLWNMLIDKYQNKRWLADSYFQKMMDFRPLSAESAEALDALAERFNASFHALRNLQLPDLSDYFASAIILSKLDSATRKNFEMSNTSSFPSYDEVISFVRHQANALRQLKKPNYSRSGFGLSGKSLKPSHVMVTSHTSENSKESFITKRNCPFCRESHNVFQCSTFSKASSSARWNLVKKRTLCFNCLSDRHTLSSCNSQNSCKVCQKRHHTLLHYECNPSQKSKENVPSSVDPVTQNLCALTGAAIKSRAATTVVLPTAVVLISTVTGEKRAARFLIDTASQSHLITLNACRKFKLPICKFDSTVAGIGGVSEKVLGEVNFILSSRMESTACWEINARVVRRITDKMPVVPLCESQKTYFRGLQFADECYDVPGPIDGVLGAAFFSQIIKNSEFVGPISGPIALPTRLGYLVMGEALTSLPSVGTVRSFCTFSEPLLEIALHRFWELEEVGGLDSTSLKDDCDQFFSQTTTRNSEGRYCVHLPFKEQSPQLGDSFTIARQRFLNLEKQFNKNPELHLKYIEGMRDYLTQGHISEVVSDTNLPSYYIPHFAVRKESSTTPVRIVFDASCKTSNGQSLNDVLYTGPKLQTEIQEILVRFRINPVAIVADIRQMYRNILVYPPHRRYQCLLWRFDPQEELKTYQINCVPFGLKPAPFLALRTIQQLCSDEASNFPLASKVARNDMYIDDIVTSIPLSDTAVIYRELKELFTAGGFSLVKWATNSDLVARDIPECERESPTIKFWDSENEAVGIKVLGLNWNSADDHFFFSICFQDNLCTKRQILSTLAKIWDPLGFLSPVTIMCKILIKQLWLCKCDWDDTPPPDIKRKWSRFVSEITSLSKLKIPRFTGLLGGSNIFLVGFADSSAEGYGAVIYAVPKEATETVKPIILISKSKVAPMKTCSIPRLELCAALLLAKLFRVISKSLDIPLKNLSIYAFSDSEVALQWIMQSPHKWKTFVSNRVAQIQEMISPSNWWHVPGTQNVADHISRGLSPSQLASLCIWVHGPLWLTKGVEYWPISRPKLSTNLQEEEKVLTAVSSMPDELNSVRQLILRCSSWEKLLRITVYILRFLKRLPFRCIIKGSDLEMAELALLKMVQRSHFVEEFNRLAAGKLCSPVLRSLRPFIDAKGCIRVGGRLGKAFVSYDYKHPLLLPKKDVLVDLLIDAYHQRYLHTGPNLLMSILRQRYWILGGRSLIRFRIKRCNFCFRCNPVTPTPLMADLPLPRVSQAKAFLHCGVDYAGPFSITIGRYRGNRCQKAYLCLFICLSTKAVHLELASDLSTPTFLNCLKRFLSRRGPISALYSDCGTNFLGARAELDALHSLLDSNDYKKAFEFELSRNRIDWHLNPPSAPHFGGLWESNIKSVKIHLRRVIGNQILSYEELYTVLTQIEALLNSRPLGWIGSDPSDPSPITPAHFLTLSPLCSLPAPDLTDSHNLRSRKELLDSLVQTYWKRWRDEYLHTLQARQKWNSPQCPIKPGLVVLLKDNVPPLQWPLGIVEEVFPGSDGIIRVAAVRIGKRILTRPATKLCPLPSQ